MRLEIDLRSDWLAIWPGHITRVEPAIGSSFGCPDTFLVYGHVQGWLEFKILDHNGQFTIKPSQRLWHKQFIEYGGRAAFCFLDQRGWVLLSAEVVLVGREVSVGHIPWSVRDSDFVVNKLARIFCGEVGCDA